MDIQIIKCNTSNIKLKVRKNIHGEIIDVIDIIDFGDIEEVK